jgi:hypothetical protein
MGGSSFTGGDASSFDVAAAVASATSVNWASTNLTTAEDNELLVGFGRIVNAGLMAPVGSTVELLEDATTGDIFYLVYRLAGAAGSYNVASTHDASTAWVALAIAMKQAAAPAGGNVVAWIRA